MKKISLIAAFLLILSVSLFSQAGSGIFQPGDFRDGIYDKENSVNRRFIPYTFLRQGDVMWEKRVWREIDLREKINQPLYYPTEEVNGRSSLLQVLKRALFTQEIIAFSDEEFLIPMTLSQIREKLVKCDSVNEIGADDQGNEVVTRLFKCDSTTIYENVTKIRLKEDWFFDKQKSVLEVRILGLSAMKYDEAKDIYTEVFWVYFPSCRNVLATNEVFNTKNDAERRTFDDIFFKRQFNSTSIKETNVYDRGINQYAKGIDALLESDRIKNDIFQFEHDLWHF
jgi:gliding motility associated protien GldN